VSLNIEATSMFSESSSKTLQLYFFVCTASRKVHINSLPVRDPSGLEQKPWILLIACNPTPSIFPSDRYFANVAITLESPMCKDNIKAPTNTVKTL